jgi:hypothetical protein
LEGCQIKFGVLAILSAPQPLGCCPVRGSIDYPDRHPPRKGFQARSEIGVEYYTDFHFAS